MTQFRMNDPASAERAKKIAIRTLDGDYDPLLACRDLASLRERLRGVDDDVMITFIGVASEMDDLPIGAERKYWSAEALRSKAVQAADYRERVRGTVSEALKDLLVALGAGAQTS